MANSEILRLVYLIIGALVTILTAFGIAVDPGLQENAVQIIGAAATIIGSVVALLEYARTKVWSKDSADLLATTILTANKTGEVPYGGLKAAKQVDGVAAQIIPAGLTTGLVALGFPANYAAIVGVEAAKIALKAGRELAARPLSSDELKAARDEARGAR